MRLATWLGIVGVSALAACSQDPASDRLTVGEPLPALVFQDLETDQTHALKDYRGQFVVLNVWGTWCAPCRKELPALQALSERLGEKFAVVGLAAEDKAFGVREYLRQRGVTFANYLDPGRRMAEEVMGITVFPNTFLVAPDGMLLARFVGAQPWDSDALYRQLQALARQWSGAES